MAALCYNSKKIPEIHQPKISLQNHDCATCYGGVEHYHIYEFCYLYAGFVTNFLKLRHSNYKQNRNSEYDDKTRKYS